jgi:DNA-binding IclR family transcriptional regulator
LSKTIAKAIGLIETLANTAPPHGVSDLARTLRLNKATVHRLLNGLVKLGYVKQNEQSAAYELTLKLWEIGTHVLAQRDVSQIAVGILRKLAGDTGETVHLAILDGTEVVYIDKADGAHPLRIFTPIGGRVPLYCGSTGKTILAFQPAPFIDDICRNLTAFTSRTITSKARLLRELEGVKRQGYALNIGEWRIDISGIAAPIRDRTGEVVASVGVSGPSNRLPIAALRAISPTVIAAASQIATELGFINSRLKPAANGAGVDKKGRDRTSTTKRISGSSSKSSVAAQKGRMASRLSPGVPR